MATTRTALESPSLEELLARIDADVRPVLERNVSETEANRRVAQENIDALRAAGAFKVTVHQVTVSGRGRPAAGMPTGRWSGSSSPTRRARPVDQALAFIPMSELSIEETWFVAGMKGTGSNTIVATGRVRARAPPHSVPRAIDNVYAHRAHRRGAVPVVVHPGADPHPRRATARARARGPPLRDRQGAQARDHLHQVRAPDGLDGVPAADRERGDADRHRRTCTATAPRTTSTTPRPPARSCRMRSRARVRQRHRLRDHQDPRGDRRAAVRARGLELRRFQPAAAVVARLQHRRPPRRDRPARQPGGLRQGAARNPVRGEHHAAHLSREPDDSPPPRRRAHPVTITPRLGYPPADGVRAASAHLRRISAELADMRDDVGQWPTTTAVTAPRTRAANDGSRRCGSAAASSSWRSASGCCCGSRRPARYSTRSAI